MNTKQGVVVEGGAVEGGGTMEAARALGGTVVEGGTIAMGMQACACTFAVAESASGFVHLPDLSPLAYGSLWIQRCFPLVVLMLCSIKPLSSGRDTSSFWHLACFAPIHSPIWVPACSASFDARVCFLPTVIGTVTCAMWMVLRFGDGLLLLSSSSCQGIGAPSYSWFNSFSGV